MLNIICVRKLLGSVLIFTVPYVAEDVQEALPELKVAVQVCSSRNVCGSERGVAQLKFKS